MALSYRFAAASAFAAAISLAATPVAAGEHHRWHRWHDDRIDAGDVLAGAAILGGIAAIASAVSRDGHDEGGVTPPPPPVPDDRQGYTEAQPNQAAESDSNLDRAADLCAAAVDRGPDQVDSVDDVSRDRDGWSVSGALVRGAGFTCRIGNDWRVQAVNVAGSRSEAAPQDESDQPQRQPDHEAPPPPVDNRPVWHGDQAQPQGQSEQDDGRYDTSQAPDFGQSA